MNSKQAREFVADRFKHEPLYVQSIWPKYRFTVVLPQSLLLALDNGARWTIKNGLTDTAEIPNYLDFIYLDGLEEVKPEAITVIR